MSRRIRSLKRNIRENITKIPSAKSIAKGTYNAAVSAKNSVVSAKDASVSSVKKTYFGKYEDEYLNENKRDTKTDDKIGSAWIKVHDVSKSVKDKPDEIEKLRESVGTDKDKINPIIHVLSSDGNVGSDEDFLNVDLFGDVNENVNKMDEENKKKAEILEQLITHIKEKKYTEKAGIRNVKRTFSNKKIVIPYSNINENDFNVKKLKDMLLKQFKNLDKVYIEIEENGILNYYISTPIKKYIRYAIVKRGKIKEEKKTDDDLAKEEKKKKLNAKKSEVKELLDGIGIDILGDNKIDTLPPCSKLANAYCYIHPFNVILYERKIIYGLKWELARFNPEENNLYESIEEFFSKNDDIPSFNEISKKFKEVYDKTSATETAAQPQEEEASVAQAPEGPPQTGGKQIGGGKEVIDLTDLEEVRGIVYEARYLDDFKSEKFYYKYKDGEKYLYYLCKNSILDYRYNHKNWDKGEYYTENSIDKLGLQSNLNEIKKINENLTSTLESVREKARENGEINKFKELERQDRSDEIFNDNAGKFGYYTTLLFVHTAKYIQDTLLAGVKTLFSASWNNVITGFLILLFIILVIIMGVALGGGGGGGENDGPNKKPKEENKDFISLLKSMPANINSAYADFNNFATDLGNMVTNGRRAVNDFADAMTGDNIPEDSVRNAYDKQDGRGGDNIIHYFNGTKVISAYKPIAKIKPDNNNIVNKPEKGIIDDKDFSITTVDNDDSKLYELDCNNPNISKYFTKYCKLRKDYSLDTRFIKETDSDDYKQIKINN